MERQYRDSRVDWIGQIPMNWKTEKFKHVFRIKKILAGKLGYDVLSVTQQGLKVKNITSNEGQVANDYSNYQLVFPGDFVMNHMDLLTGYVDVSKQEGVTSPDYRTFYAIHKNDISRQYYLYIFQFCYKTRLFYNLGHGVSNLGRWRLPSEEQNEFMLPFPPLPEQQMIANYLDAKCGEIDGLITLQEQMIARLTEYKLSVITEIVTKGLNPDVQLVPSGIDWIGDVPKGWDTKRFKDLFRTGKGLSFTKADLVKEGIPVISYGQVHSKDNKGTRINDELIRFVPEEIAKGGESSQVHVGDFIFADTSEDLDGCGNCVYVDKEIGLYAGYHSVIATSKRKVSNAYLAYLFLTNCWRSQLRCRVSGIKVFSISQSIINQSTVILPPSDEQRAIAEHLDAKCVEIDRLIETKRQKIETLKEYKKSVIYEAVTGKTDLRDS